MIGTRVHIQNDRPIIGPYNVNQGGSGDMYYKGANMLHTLRQLVEDDELWRKILRGLNRDFYHQTVTTKQVEDYISNATGKDLSAFFNQYLRTTDIPLLEYKKEGSTLSFRYTRVVQDFDMPVRVFINGEAHWIFPDKDWKTEQFDKTISRFITDPNFYIEYRSMSGS